MDLSKLSKLSETQKHAAEPQGPDTSPQLPPPPPPVVYVPPPVGADAFINLVIALLIIYMGGWPLIDYVIHLTTGRPFNHPVTDKATGNVIPYVQSVFFWLNLGAVVFAVALILYGFVGRSLNLGLSVVVLAALWAAVAVNAYAIYVSYNMFGLQILQALCAAFGIYLGLHQWQRVKVLSKSY